MPRVPRTVAIVARPSVPIRESRVGNPATSSAAVPSRPATAKHAAGDGATSAPTTFSVSAAWSA